MKRVIYFENGNIWQLVQKDFLFKPSISNSDEINI